VLVQAALAVARVPGLVRVGTVAGPARAREAAQVLVLGRVVARQQAMAVRPLAPGSAAREAQGEEAGMAAGSWGRRLPRPPPRHNRRLRRWRRRFHRSPRRISS
jgi:hypothetical protein